MSKLDHIEKTKAERQTPSFISRIHESLKELNKKSESFWAMDISWKLSLAVFTTILCVQSLVSVLSFNSYKKDIIFQMVDNARGAVVSVVQNKGMSEDAVRILLSTTNIQGIRLYDGNVSYLSKWGNAPALAAADILAGKSDKFDSRSAFYDKVLYPNELGQPFYIGVRLNAGALREDIRNYVAQSVVVSLLLSAFLTTILMMGLSYWYLEPLTYLTGLLKKAMANPENPVLDKKYHNTGSHEITSAITAATSLIEQNSLHIKKIKSKAEDRIHKLAYYDNLTGLPNRTLFVEKLTELTGLDNDSEPQSFVVVALDLDHFRDVNDSMGHHVGDIILKCVGQRLNQALPKSAIIARAGEDEFAVMLPLIKDVNTPEDIARKVALAVKDERFKIMDEDFRIHCSVGYAVFPEDGADPDQVLKNADIALNRAKEEGRDMIRAYSRDFDVAVQARFQLLRDLRIALEEDQFELHYQPQFNLDTGKLIGVESLIRWKKPDNSKQGGTYISPGEFIPISESSGLIVPIGEWVLNEACKAALEFQAIVKDPIRVAVNVSGVQFRQRDIVDAVRNSLDNSGLNPHLLEIEVTESAFMEDVQHTISILKDLSGLGVELAIDDFGTGYSSLSYLRQFPIDRLKIDRSFIINALNNPDDASIARTIVALGKALNLQVIAEGVETIDHQKFLMDEGCHEVQGFRYSKPLPKEDFIAFCKEYKGDLSSFDKA